MVSDMVRLTAALISAEQEGADVTEITSLALPRRNIHELPGLDVCERLTRLDLSNNSLSSLEGLSTCKSLKWLSVSGNKLESFKGIESLSNLMVLNGSRNLLTSISEVSGLLDLRALVVNDNQIPTIPRLDRLSNLNTLVLSHNPIRDIGKSFNKLLYLNKLSLSHCRLQIVGASLKRCIALQELRLAHNQLMGLPKELERNGQLRILDVGNNYIREWSELQVLGSMHKLENMNLRGNPIHDHDHYHKSVTSLLPNLKILDGHPVREVHKRGQKRVAMTRISSSSKLEKSVPLLASEGAEMKPKDQRTDARAAKKTKIVFENENVEGDDDNTENFMKLIAQTKAGKNHSQLEDLDKDTQPNKLTLRNSVAESGVISASEARSVPKKPVTNAVIPLLKNLQGPEIGTGGPSTWETQVSSTSLEPRSSNSDESRKQNSLPLNTPTSYTRWKLKASNPS